MNKYQNRASFAICYEEVLISSGLHLPFDRRGLGRSLSPLASASAARVVIPGLFASGWDLRHGGTRRRRTEIGSLCVTATKRSYQSSARCCRRGIDQPHAGAANGRRVGELCGVVVDLRLKGKGGELGLEVAGLGVLPFDEHDLVQPGSVSAERPAQA